MGKKKKHSKKKAGKSFNPIGKPADVLGTITPLAIRAKDLGTEDDGFPTLVPTKNGKKLLDEVHLRRSKKFSGSVQDIVNNPKPYEEYSPNAAINMLNDAVSKVRDGKYKKAMEKRDKGLIEDLVDAFLNMEKSLPNFARVSDAITTLLRVGKSFYEYDGESREYLTNDIYDRVLAKYRGYGFEEPVGYVPSGKNKTKIKYPLLHNNMDKAYAIRSGDPIPDGVKETTKVEEWLIKSYKVLGITSETVVEVEISPKVDGISANGTVKSGEKYDKFTDPQTRGDETESVRIIGLDNIQLGDGTAENDFGLQQEIFVTDKDRIAAQEYLGLKKPYASNRHAAAGILNRLCTREDDELLTFLSFYPIEASGLDSTYVERMDFIDNFSIVPDDMIERKRIKGNLKELLDKIEKHFEKLAKKREELSYSIDGMVITFTDDDYQEQLGRNGRTNQYQIALKFDPENAQAEVTGIYLDFGKKGFRTVQVELKHPVFLDGVRYDHVPVLSAGLYEDLDLRVGSEVNVHRVGDVIPSITVINRGNGKRLKLPDKCPICGHDLRIKNKKLYCSYSLCKGNVAGKISGFIDAIGMTGYADSFADDLVEKCGITSLSELLKLDEGKMVDAGLNSKSEKAFPALLKEILANVEDYRILGAIGIPDIGPARAKNVLKISGGWKQFVKEMTSDSWRHSFTGYPELMCNELWDSFNSDTKDGFSDPDTAKVLKALEPYVEIITERFDNPRLGHTGISPSDIIRQVCKKANIDVVDGKAFDMLLTGSMESNSDKMETAKKKGLPIYTEDMFLKQYGD